MFPPRDRDDDPVAIFDSLLKPQGGRLELERLGPPGVKAFYKKVRETIANLIEEIRGIPECNTFCNNLYFDFILNKNVNAIAWSGNRRHIIGVNSGLVDTVLMACDQLFATRDFFPGIGFPELEDPVDSFESGFHLANQLRSATDTHYRLSGWKSPKCPHRIFASKAVALLAVQWVFLHELSHLVCGHLEVMKHFGLPLRMEEDALPITNDALIHRNFQSAERDADCMALQMQVLSGLIYPGMDLTNLENDLQEYILGDIYQSSEYARRFYQYLYGIATTTIMLILTQRGPQNRDWNQSTHPHPMTRLLSLDWALVDLYQRDLGGVDQLFTDTWFRAARHTKVVWEQLRLPGHNHLPSQNDEQAWNSLFQGLEQEILWTVKDERSTLNISDRNGHRSMGNAIIRHLRTKIKIQTA